MKNQVAIVIPYYHEKLEWFEKIGLEHCLKILGKYPIILLTPMSIYERDSIQQYNLQIIKVPDKYLESISSYNKMVMTKEFYSLFIDFEYILIYQLDAIVFEDKLEYFCELGYDYIGAPWLQGSIDFRHLGCDVKYVGNGGLSLRKVSSFLEIINQSKIDYDYWTEDLFWSNQESEAFRVAPLDVALTFSIETQVERCYELNHNTIPFGSHAWHKYNLPFWNKKCELHLDEQFITDDRCFQDRNSSYEEIAFLGVTPEIIYKWIQFHSVNKIIIYGTGYLGNMCGWILRYVVNPYVIHVSNEKKIWGKVFTYDRRIYPIFDILKFNNANTLIVIAEQDIENAKIQLKKMGIVNQNKIISYLDLMMEINYFVLN